MSQIRTVVELDMVGYSDIARELEENLDVSVVGMLNEKIQQFVNAGLHEIGKTREEVVKATNGDNAVIVFESAGDAHLFAQTVHKYTQNYNDQREKLSAKRWFRIGCATGELHQDSKDDKENIAGTVIATAYRLEAAAKPGQLLIDTKTYDALSAEQKRHYSDVEEVSGKRNEKFRVRRWEIVPRVLFLGLIAQENFQLRNAVNRYESNFQSIKEIISSLDHYKSLHDYFQELEGLIGTLKSNELKIDNYVVRQLVFSGKKLKEIIDKISPILKSGELNQDLGSQKVVNWTDQLDLSYSNIVKAAEKQTPDELIKDLKKSISNINSVIGIGLPLLNQKLFNKAQLINHYIKPAIDCLSNIQSILDDSRLFYQHELDSFSRDNIEEIKQILVALDREINIHNLCQEINDRVNVIDSELGNKTINEAVNESFVDQWESLKKSLERLYEPNEPRINDQSEVTLEKTEKIRRGVINVSQSIRDNGAVSAKFYDLKDDTYKYFVSVDTRLLETIGTIADKLKNKIENDPKDTLQPQVQNEDNKYIVFLSQKLGWSQ